MTINKISKLTGKTPESCKSFIYRHKDRTIESLKAWRLKGPRKKYKWYTMEELVQRTGKSSSACWSYVSRNPNRTLEGIAQGDRSKSWQKYYVDDIPLKEWCKKKWKMYSTILASIYKWKASFVTIKKKTI